MIWSVWCHRSLLLLVESPRWKAWGYRSQISRSFESFSCFFSCSPFKRRQDETLPSLFSSKVSLAEEQRNIHMHIYASEHFVPGGRCGVGNHKEVEFQTGRCLSGAWTSSFQVQVTRVCRKTHLSYFHLSMQSQTSFVNVFEMFVLSWNLPFWRWTNMVGYVAGYFLPAAVDLVDLAHVRLFDSQVLLELPSYHDQRWSDEATAEVAICIHSKCKSPRLHATFLWPRREKGKIRDFKIYYCRFDSRIDSWNKILLDPSVPLGFWRIWIQFNSHV